MQVITESMFARGSERWTARDERNAVVPVQYKALEQNIGQYLILYVKKILRYQLFLYISIFLLLQVLRLMDPKLYSSLHQIDS